MHLPLSGFPALLQAVEIRLVGQVPPAPGQSVFPGKLRKNAIVRFISFMFINGFCHVLIFFE